MKFDENVETATTGALKCCGGSLRDNLSDLHERKAPQREGLKLPGVRMWKIIVGDSRQNRHGWRCLSAAAPEGILEILGTRD